MTDRPTTGEQDLLAASEERFRWLTGVVSDPLLIADLSGGLLHYNRAAAALFGHDVLAGSVGGERLDLTSRLMAAEGSVLELVADDGEVPVSVVPVSFDTSWDGTPATTIVLRPADGRAGVSERADDRTSILLIEVSDANTRGRTLPAAAEILDLLEPGEGLTHAGGAAWCVIWRSTDPEVAQERAADIVDGLSSSLGERGVVRAGVAHQRPGEDTPSLLRRCHRSLQQARIDEIELSAYVGVRRAPPELEVLRADVVEERVGADLVPVVDLGAHRALGAVARPTVSDIVVSDPRQLLQGAEPDLVRAFDRLVAAEAMVRFHRWRETSRRMSLHLPLHGVSTRSAETTIGWLQRVVDDVGLARDEIVLGVHEADVVADPHTLRFLSAAKMSGFRGAIRALSGARLPLAALVDAWPDALLLASSVVRGDESRLLPVLLAAADEISALAIATGVTTPSQVDLLLDYECRYGVGPALTRSIHTADRP
ncbi:MAG: EAL domain-containing protein [Actinomycetota bacterium]